MEQIKPGAIIIEGHVQGLANTRALGEAGIQVIVVDKKDCIARHSKYCVGFYRSPDYLTDDFIEFLINLARENGLMEWVLIPSNDHAVYNISKNKSLLEKYFKVITPELEIIDKIYDKVKLIGVAGACCVPYPVTQLFLSVDDPVKPEMNFPLLTKGRNGLSFYKATSKTAFKSDNETELRIHLKEIEGKIPLSATFTQEVIPSDGTNKTISLAAFCDRGLIKAHWMGRKMREHPLQFGTSTFSESILIPECFEQSVPLLKALNYTGVCEVEFLLDPRSGKYKLIEINARTWLWVGLAKACGVNFTKMIYDYMNGIEIEFPSTYTTGVSWINPFSDTAYALIGMIKGKVNPVNYLSSILTGKKVNALFDRKDIRPAFAYFANIFSFIAQR